VRVVMGVRDTVFLSEIFSRGGEFEQFEFEYFWRGRAIGLHEMDSEIDHLTLWFRLGIPEVERHRYRLAHSHSAWRDGLLLNDQQRRMIRAQLAPFDGRT
jgi:hypothetical protein